LQQFYSVFTFFVFCFFVFKKRIEMEGFLKEHIFHHK